MEWTNPTTVVKQSASVMITILGILILILVVVAVSVVLVKVFNITKYDDYFKFSINYIFNSFICFN